jgi:hypothetical protein
MIAATTGPIAATTGPARYTVSAMLTVLRRGAVLLLLPALASCALWPDSEERGALPAKPVTSVVVPPLPPFGAIEPAFFGVHDHNPVGDDPAGWAAAPVGSLRAWDAGVIWRDIELSPGVYDFGRLDQVVDTAEAHGSDVLIVLGQTPSFHAKQPKAKSFYGDGAASPPTVKSWSAYVRALAERYAGRPVAYQVWNEANIKGFWRGTPAEMATLTKAAWDVLATITPRPTLVGPAFVTRLIGQRAWFDSYYAERVAGAPVADFVDVVSLQLYPDAHGTPETAMNLLTAARVTLDRRNVDKPIWNTEVNYGLTGLPVDPAPVDQQQANVARTYLLNAAQDIDRVYWYGWDQQSIVNTLLTEPDAATVTPAGRTFTQVQEWLVGSLMPPCGADASGTYSCLLRRSVGVRHVYWNPTKTVSITVPENATRYEKADGTKGKAVAGQPMEVGALPVMVESSE